MDVFPRIGNRNPQTQRDENSRNAVWWIHQRTGTIEHRILASAAASQVSSKCVLSGEQEPSPPVNWRTTSDSIRNRAQYLSILAAHGFAAICDLDAPLTLDSYEMYSAGSGDKLPDGGQIANSVCLRAALASRHIFTNPEKAPNPGFW